MMQDPDRPSGRRSVSRSKRDMTEVIPWWYDLVSAVLASPVADSRRAVFTNRTLRMDRLSAVGFDFDHTLAVYNCAALDELAMNLVIDRLVEHEGFSRSFVDELPEPEFARKGLIVDIEHGAVLKTDRYGHVARAYRGTQRMTSAERKEVYGGVDVIPHVTQGKRFIQLDSAFAKPEVLIYAALVSKVKPDECHRLWHTVRGHTDMIHRDGSLKEVIMADPAAYLNPDLETVGMLRRLRDAGKTVFLLTNSEWEYTNAMINPALGLGESGGLEWRDLFDHVVVEARKPTYFQNKSSRKSPPVVEIEDVDVMQGGSITDLEEHLGCSGPDVLYVGDHIYADLITSKRAQHWRTMLVVSEVEEEIDAQSMLPGMAEQLMQIDERRTRTEREVQHWKSVESVLDVLADSESHELVARIRAESKENRRTAVAKLRAFIEQRESLRREISHANNKYWGSLFRTGSELTYYGRQVEDFACTYTGRATNIGLYPADHYFRSAMDYLPHELEMM